MPTARSVVQRTALLWLFFVSCGVFGAWTALGLAAPPKEAAIQQGAVTEVKAAQPADALQQEAARRDAAQREAPGPIYRVVSFLGLFALVGLCALFSSNRKAIDWRLVGWGLGLQLAFGFLVLNTEPGRWFFSKLNDGTMALLAFTREGSNFLFAAFGTGKIEGPLQNFTFSVLPTIIFLSSLMTVLYYLGIMQRVVYVFAVAMQKTMRTSGAETLSAAANIFVGQTEAPLVIKPYLPELTNSEMMAVMVGGFANTAAGVLAAYVGMLHPYFPDVAGHLIAQSVMSAPASLLCAKIVFPEDGSPKTAGTKVRMIEQQDANVIDAAARGASEGLYLALNVAAMLLAFIALIAMINAIVHRVGLWIGAPQLSLELLLGYVSYPFALLMGVPLQDCFAVGKLIGVKTVVNEFVAYLQMSELLKAGSPMTHRSMVIASYALCGFGNFSSIAIQIGGISALAPTRRHDLARLGMKAMLTGCLATFMTASIAGVLIP